MSASALALFINRKTKFMNILRAAILIGQIGKIWAISSTHKKLFQSLSVIGYFTLMESMNNNNGQVFTLGNMSTGNIKPKKDKNIIHIETTFNNHRW